MSSEAQAEGGAKEGETWERAYNVLIVHQCVALPEDEWLG